MQCDRSDEDLNRQLQQALTRRISSKNYASPRSIITAQAFPELDSSSFITLTPPSGNSASPSLRGEEQHSQNSPSFDAPEEEDSEPSSPLSPLNQSHLSDVSSSSCSSSSTSSSDEESDDDDYAPISDQIDQPRTFPSLRTDLPPPYPFHLHLATPYTPRYTYDKVKRKTDSAKSKHRTSLALEEWGRYKYVATFENLKKEFMKSMPKMTINADKLPYFPYIEAYAPPIDLTAGFSSINIPTGGTEDSMMMKKNKECEVEDDSTSMMMSRKSAPLSNGTSPLSSRPPLAPYDPTHPVSIGIDRMHTRELSVNSFIEEYEKLYIPVMITGLTDNWNARHWSFAGLDASPYRECLFKCGEDDDGYSIKIKLKYFLQYLHTQKDDSPLYIFDSAFDDDSIGKGILGDFTVPHYFQSDLFSLVGENRRPPYRWFLVGPQRSGSSLHIDPLATSAWNTLLVGVKRWVMFPPNSPKARVKGDHLKDKGEDGEAITYFTKILPRIKAEEQERMRAGLPLLGIRECIQYPGDTIFVPGGWWHAVLNVEDSLAVTQNFASPTNFAHVWRKTRLSRKKMARTWLKRLFRSGWSELGTEAVLLNESDGFELERSRGRKKRNKKKKGSKEGRKTIPQKELNDDINNNHHSYQDQSYETTTEIVQLQSTEFDILPINNEHTARVARMSRLSEKRKEGVDSLSENVEHDSVDPDSRLILNGRIEEGSEGKLKKKKMDHSRTEGEMRDE